MTSTYNKVGLNRNTIDKFYTNPDVVVYCFKLIKKYLKIRKTDLVIEPSAGNGAFINGIKEITDNYLFYDIKPEHKDIVSKDFLKINYKSLLKKYKNNRIFVIGNPPFGRQSSTAIKFIKKSCKFCDSISMILPKSFKKQSLKKKIPLNFHLLTERNLPNNSFNINGNKYNVPCIFQIWIKKSYNRRLLKNIKPNNYIFVKKTQRPDISIRRVGINAGKADININKNINSHYFIKINKNYITTHIKNDIITDKDAKKKLIYSIVNKLNNIHYIFDNNVGPRSLNKQDIIRKYNTIFTNI